MGLHAAVQLTGQETSRVQELVPVRHARMATSAFAFYRGGALVMAADLALMPRTSLHVQFRTTWPPCRTPTRLNATTRPSPPPSPMGGSPRKRMPPAAMAYARRGGSPTPRRPTPRRGDGADPQAVPVVRDPSTELDDLGGAGGSRSSRGPGKPWGSGALRHILLSGREADRGSLRVSGASGYSSRAPSRAGDRGDPPRRRRQQTGATYAPFN
jgi:hypothetical protein